MEVDYPTTNFNVNYAAEIVLIIDINSTRGGATKSLLKTLGFAVIGPIPTLNDHVHMLKRIEVKVILYQLDASLEVIFQFITAITHLPSIPLLLIGSIDPVIKRKLNKISNPVANILNVTDETQLLKNLQVLIHGASSLTDEPPIIKFCNTIIAELLQITPRENKGKAKQAVAYAIKQITQLEANIKALDETNFVLTGLSAKHDDIAQSLKMFIWTIIDALDDNEKTPWGTAIMKDAVLQTLYKFQPLSDDLKLFAESLDLGSLHVPLIKSDFQNTNRFDTHLAFIALDDMGPDVIIRYNDDGAIFNIGSASQLISLVGQGEMYHEGLFGPIPISKNDIMTLIYSKLLTDESIKDHRLQGRTLALTALAFNKALVPLLPDRIRLQRIFDPFARLTNVTSVSDDILKQIDDNFHKFF